jgi:hypothetical protein
MEPIVISDKVFLALIDAGIFHEADKGTVRRVVIDLQAGEPAMIHVERWGDRRLLEVAGSMVGVQVRGVDREQPANA